jgi:hypothetical protein
MQRTLIECMLERERGIASCRGAQPSIGAAKNRTSSVCVVAECTRLSVKSDTNSSSHASHTPRGIAPSLADPRAAPYLYCNFGSLSSMCAWVSGRCGWVVGGLHAPGYQMRNYPSSALTCSTVANFMCVLRATSCYIRYISDAKPTLPRVLQYEEERKFLAKRP